MPQNRQVQNRQARVRAILLSRTHLALKMDTLLQIASRVEAAVEAYTSVHDFADQEQWRKMFKKELVSLNLHGDRSLYISNRKKSPAIFGLARSLRLRTIAPCTPL